LQNFSVELFHERAGRLQIGKTPPKIDVASFNNSSSIPRLNFSRAVKVQHPPAHFDIQFIINDEKLDDVGIFTLVCDRLPVKSLGHMIASSRSPAGLLADKHRQPRDIRRDPSGLVFDEPLGRFSEKPRGDADLSSPRYWPTLICIRRP
jgi:hypothetical protein